MRCVFFWLIKMSPVTFPPFLILLVRAEMVVDFPHPDGPMMAVIVPDSKFPETLSRIFLPSRKTTLMLMNSMSILCVCSSWSIIVDCLIRVLTGLWLE